MTATKPASRKKRKKKAAKPLKALCAGLVALILLIVAAYLGNRYMEKRTYRLLYPEEILAWSAEFSLNPALVSAVIHVESENRPAVVSPKGAVGLMQILPSTGEWIAQKLGLADFQEKSLAEPAMNIRMGCWYLRFLLDRFENENTALAAYNAGPSKVKQWLEDPLYGEGGALIAIPYGETERYVQKVAAAKEKYATLYEKELAQQ